MTLSVTLSCQSVSIVGQKERNTMILVLNLNQTHTPSTSLFLAILYYDYGILVLMAFVVAFFSINEFLL